MPSQINTSFPIAGALTAKIVRDNFVTAKAELNGKSDAVHTHDAVTASISGFMSSADKIKLDGIATGANNYVHPASGVTAGTYRSVTVNAQGHITAGTNPTTLAGYGITDGARKFNVVHSNSTTNGTALEVWTDYSLYVDAAYSRSLPANPALGDTIILNNLYNTWGSGLFTLTRANTAHSINGIAEDMLFDTNVFKRAVLSYQWANSWIMALS